MRTKEDIIRYARELRCEYNTRDPYILAAVLYGGYQDISLSLATGKRLCHNRTGLCVRPESR